MLEQYDFTSLVLLTFGLLTAGGFLAERWMPTWGVNKSMVPGFPLVLLYSVGKGAFKVSTSAFGIVWQKSKRSSSKHHHHHNRVGGKRSNGKLTTATRSMRQGHALGLLDLGAIGHHFRKSDLMAFIYHQLPFNALSRVWGFVNQINLPVVVRAPFYRLYGWAYGCKLEEALIEDLSYYKNLSEFFRRPIKTHLRPIYSSSCLTSPVDGQVLYCGQVEAGHVEQVKGLRYTLRGFLGPVSWKSSAAAQTNFNATGNGPLTTSTKTSVAPSSIPIINDVDLAYHDSVKQNPANQLFHCVIYLAPGDYHRFHSAADWKVKMRRHFPGKLLSVNPRVARWIRGLFCINERAVYVGEWEHGFFSYTAVGATNVGSIRVFCDTKLRTNTKARSHNQHHYTTNQAGKVVVAHGGRHRYFFDKNLEALASQSPIETSEDPPTKDNHNITFNLNHVTGDKDQRKHVQKVSPNAKLNFVKGELFGEFNFGSTVVLIFEAPSTFKFNVKPGQKLLLGQPLGDFGQHELSTSSVSSSSSEPTMECNMSVTSKSNDNCLP